MRRGEGRRRGEVCVLVRLHMCEEEAVRVRVRGGSGSHLHAQILRFHEQQPEEVHEL